MSKTSEFISSVTDELLNTIEAGTSPWKQTWRGGPPYNLLTGKMYRGFNLMYLLLLSMQKAYSCNAWLTFKQAQQLKGTVRKGEKATRCIFYKTILKDGNVLPP